MGHTTLLFSFFPRQVVPGAGKTRCQELPFARDKKKDPGSQFPNLPNISGKIV